MKDTPGTVYLIHFDRPFRDRVRHYLGWTGLPLQERMKRHRDQRGAALLRAVQAEGVGYRVVRVWVGGTPDLEARLKRQRNHKRFCPICSSNGGSHVTEEDQP